MPFDIKNTQLKYIFKMYLVVFKKIKLSGFWDLKKEIKIHDSRMSTQ